MNTYKVLVCMANGEKIYLDNASNYFVNSNKRLIEVVINGYRQFFNLDFVSYVGRAFDLEQGDVE